MIWRLGPVTIMSTKTRDAYKTLANAAYQLHQAIWYAEDLNEQADYIRRLDAALSEAISHTPPEDIE